MMENTEAITIPEIAEKMRLAEQTVRNKVVGKLKLKCRHRVVGRRLEFHREDFNEYINSTWKKPGKN